MHQFIATLVHDAIQACLPDAAVKRALSQVPPPQGEGKRYLIAIGKAAWRMAHAALLYSDIPFAHGIVLTKYGHIEGPLPPFELYEAAHPVPDEKGVWATEKILKDTSNLTGDDQVIFLISGGGSALFEAPFIPLVELQSITDTLLRVGASIQEINTIRKRLSRVKGGRFAEHCLPASVYAIVLSDVLGDRLDTIASGPAYPDATTRQEAEAIALQYDLSLSKAAQEALAQETPKSLCNVHTFISGNVHTLAEAASQVLQASGYQTTILSEHMDGEAREVGALLGSVAKTFAGNQENLPRAFIFGGETVVHVQGQGLGGRSQELALAAAPYLEGLDDAWVIAFGSDGTDGPTDAAGAFVDGASMARFRASGINFATYLQNNDAYHAHEKTNQLIKTGPTGTNVNDLAIVLIGAPRHKKRS